MNWKPRNNVMILRGVISKDIYNKKLQIDEAKANAEKNEDGNPIEAIELDGFTEIDVIDEDGNYYFDDYNFFIEDKGPEVSNDLFEGDEVYLNARNVSVIRNITDRSKAKTYFFATDGMITMRQPGPSQI